MGKIIITYWKNLLCDAWNAMWGELGILGFLFGLILSGIYSLVAGQKFDFGGVLMFTKVFLLLIILAWLFYIIKVSAIQDEKKTCKLILKEYDDINLVHYKYPRADQYKYKQPFDKYIAGILAFQVESRGGARLIKCGIRFLDAKYKFFEDDSAVITREGKHSWETMPDIEKKLLKWDDELRGKDGLIDIGSKSDEIVKLAVFPTSDTSLTQLFCFIFSDKTSEIPRIAGEYNITLRLEGKVEEDGLLVDIDPVLFDVRFDFRYNFVSDSVKVKKHEKQEKTDKKDNP